MAGWPKVLIGAPIFDGMKYCFDNFIEGVKSISYPNADILLVDNSRTDEFYSEMEKLGEIMVLKDETTASSPAERLVSSRNKILDYAVTGLYDYVFMLDADVVCPPNIIEELMACRKDIVSGLYFNYFNVQGGLKILSVAWKEITPSEFEEIKTKALLSSEVNSHEDLQRHLTQKEIDSNELLEVLYPSAGCMLLSKNVFWKIRYGLLKKGGLNVVSDDIYFIKEARAEGFKAFCHTKFKCDHLLEGKYATDENGDLIHPLNEDFYKRVK